MPKSGNICGKLLTRKLRSFDANFERLHIVKSPQRNNQTGSTFPLPMKRIPPFRLVGKRFYDPNASPYKAVFRITTDFIWRILLCMKNI